MKKFDRTKLNGKYAMQRADFLENYAKDIFDAMVEDESIYDHLNNVQETVYNYVNERVDRVRQSAEYKAAEASGGWEAAYPMINTELVSAELDAGKEWIYNLPNNDEEDEGYDEDDESEENDPFFEMYLSIQMARQELMNLEPDSESEE